MPVYEYKALDAGGKRCKGIIDADSIATARQKLRENNIYPVTLKETSQKKEKEEVLSRTSLGSLLKKVSLREISAMTRQLATLLGAGMPLVPSLDVLVSQTVNPFLKTVLAQVKDSVFEGNSLAHSISHYPKIFTPLFVSMVRAGEASGTLNIVLERLADFNEKQQALRGRINAALAYPLFMFLVGVLVLFFLVTFIIPQVTGIFEEMHQNLPGITVFLMVLCDFLKNYWLILVLCFFVAGIGLRYGVKKIDRGQFVWDKLKLQIPLVGQLIRKMAVARFSRTLATLLQGGVPLLTSLSMVRNVVLNSLFADAVQRASLEVEEGKSLAAALGNTDLFPLILIQMIAVGEQSGTLETMLFKVADSLETEVESQITMLTSMLEPIMILVMGLSVGFIVISILLPIFEMNQLIR